MEQGRIDQDMRELERKRGLHTFAGGDWVWRFAFAASVTGGLWATTTVSNALEPEDVLLFSHDPVSLRPQFRLSETVDDNIFYRENNAEGDFITRIDPGLNLQIGRDSGNYLSATYTFEGVVYAGNSELNTAQHFLRDESHFKWSRLELKGSDSIGFASQLLQGGERGFGLNRNVDVIAFSDTYRATLALTPKISTYVAPSYSAYDYESGIGLRDVNTWRGTLGFGFAMFPKLSLFGETYYGQSASTPNGTSTSATYAAFVGGFLGAHATFTEKFDGTAKVGYEEFGINLDQGGHGGIVAEADLTESFTEKTRLTARYLRSNSLSAQYVNQSYTTDLVGLRLDQALGTRGKWEAAIGGDYYVNGYSTESGPVLQRDDSFYRGYATLTYNIQIWMRLVASFEHTAFRSSDPRVFDYDVNRFMVQLNIGY